MNGNTYIIEFGAIGTSEAMITGEYLLQDAARVEAANRAFLVMDICDVSVWKPTQDSYVATAPNGTVYFWRVTPAAPTPTPEPAPATDNPDADVTDADFARWEAELVAEGISRHLNDFIDRAERCIDMPGATDEVKQQMAALVKALTAAKQVADTL